MLALLLLIQDDVGALVEKQVSAQISLAAKVTEAHRALDAMDFARAAALAGEAKGLQDDIAKLRARIKERTPAYVDEQVARLEADDPDKRDDASKRLQALGPAAIPHLVKVRAKVESAEARARLDVLLEGITIDERGLIHQWAHDATASSEYSSPDWSAKQACGPPDTLEGGDAKTAWATKVADGGVETLTLRYRIPVLATKVRIHENLTPGGVIAIEIGGKRVWEGASAGGAPPVWCEIDLKGVAASEITLAVDTARGAGWEEIDAVELIGRPLEE